MIIDIRNLFIHGDIRNIFRFKKIKDVRLSDIRNLFEHDEEEENFHKPVRVSIFSRTNYIECESKGDRNRILSVEKYLNKKLDHT